MTIQEKILRQLFRQWNGNEPNAFEPLPASGSYRQYFRIYSATGETAIGAYNEDLKENIAFLSHTRHFLQYGIKVPAIYAENLEHHSYLLEDLGDITLLNFIQEKQKTNQQNEIIEIYKKILTELPRIQILAGKNIDYSVCYPRTAFDKQSMMWDLHYFKYHFLKFLKVPFNEQDLEDDFNTFSDYLLTTDCNYFLYRDFQSRNIMIKENDIYFIDYQGGRKGALQYDLASLLMEAKTNLPTNLREELYDFYVSQLSSYIKTDKKQFEQFYYAYALIRVLQACGAYGFRGLFERKTLFIQSIPGAVRNIKELLSGMQIPVKLPELTKVLYSITCSEVLQKILQQELPGQATEKTLPETSQAKKTIVWPGLTVRINSFSYRKGIPTDESGNGGGFVFDCRSIQNPGKIESLKNYTGLDKPIQHFFETTAKEECDNFLTHVYALIDQTIKKYIQEKYTHLMVNFGCTGGRHRSVYCAEKLAQYLKGKENIHIQINHIEQEQK